MAEPIIITMEDGKEYTLEFDREAVTYAERIGFSMDDIDSKMMNRVPELFWLAFRKNHPKVTKKEADHILFDELGGAWEALITRLGELFADGYTSLVNEEEQPKNPKVRVLL